MSCPTMGFWLCLQYQAGSLLGSRPQLFIFLSIFLNQLVTSHSDHATIAPTDPSCLGIGACLHQWVGLLLTFPPSPRVVPSDTVKAGQWRASSLPVQDGCFCSFVLWPKGQVYGVFSNRDVPSKYSGQPGATTKACAVWTASRVSLTSNNSQGIFSYLALRFAF